MENNKKNGPRSYGGKGCEKKSAKIKSSSTAPPFICL